MSAGGQEYTFYFAWTVSGAPWDVSLARFDENIFDMVIQHDEGQIPTATIEIKNPRIGLISPTRLYWAWVSFSREACPPQPLFFGRLVGIPEEIEQNTLSIKFIARAPDYIFQKQRVADTLKVLPNYDPIFFEVMKRDDPDAILEGWSVLYHVDRVSNKVSTSDILLGEDGTVTFATQDVTYDSLKTKILQSPLVAVNVKAEVAWEQQYRGNMYIGQWAYPTLGGDAFVGDWPKSGASLGGGWFGGISWAGERDPDPLTEGLLKAKPTQPSYSFSWQNKAKTHTTGDTMSVNYNYTPTFGTAIVIRELFQAGLVDPYSVDQNGDPAPTNIPAKVNVDWFCYKTFALDFLGKQSMAMLELVYRADRKRSERVEMTVQADVQPVLIDPLVTEDTEQVTLKSGDLSLPILAMENWSSVGKGGAVSLGQFIYPDNPLVPGQTTSQICVQAGHTGMAEPVFSNIAGAVTVDGTVKWASLGDTQPTENAQDWVQLGRVPLGALLLPKPIAGVPNFASVVIPGQLSYPPTGMPVSIYSIYSSGDGGPGDTMYECTVGGMVGGFGGYLPPGVPPPPPPPFPLDPTLPLPPPASFQTFTNPTGAFMHICVRAGFTGAFHPTFNEGTGAQTADGGVIWQCIGQANLPIGGWPGMTPAPTYFPTDRGLKSVQHMFCRARAKLRKRARAVDVSFDTRFEVAAQLSCRMNGVVSDIRLPGGTAAGKVTSYKLECHGETGEIIGRVTLGCAIGKHPVGFPALVVVPQDVPITTDPGWPSYVVNGYVQPGYQQYYATGSTPGDPSYIPPGESGALSPGDPGYVLPFTLATSAISFPPPALIDSPLQPPTLPPMECPPLNSLWSAGPTFPVGNEIGYTPPSPAPNDDGLHFPLHPSDAILSNGWHGIASTLNPINIARYNLELDIAIHDAVAAARATTGGSFDISGGQSSSWSTTIPANPIADIISAADQAILSKLLNGQGLWYELVLKPLTNGPFANYYVVQTTKLQVPKSIDLSAPSSGG